MSEPDDDPLSLEMIMAALRADSADVSVYARVLSESLSQALPPDCVLIKRERSMADKMRGRAGEVSVVEVRLGDQLMTLSIRNGQPSTEVCREVRGVVLSRERIPLQDWAKRLAEGLVAQAESNAQTAEVLRRLVTGGT